MKQLMTQKIMTSKSTILTVLLVLFVSFVVISQFAGQPAVLFVETGSMSPTLEPNDGFVAIPSIIAGEPEVGDIIVFQSQEIGGGEITTHRVVSITEDGEYITQGDANPFTDQSDEEPPVSDGQVRSIAPEIFGSPIVIPGLGLVVSFMGSIGSYIQSILLEPLGFSGGSIPIITLVIGFSLLIYSLVGDPENEDTIKSRSKRTVRQNPLIFIIIISLLVLVPVNASMLLNSGVFQYEILSSEAPVEGNPQIIAPNTTTQLEYTIINSGYVPFVVYMDSESSGVDISESQHYSSPRSNKTINIDITSPDETGRYMKYIRVYRYLPVLPPFMISYLHNISPILAYLGINLALGSITTIISFILVGTEQFRFRDRKRKSITLKQQIKRKVPFFLLPDFGDKSKDKNNEK